MASDAQNAAILQLIQRALPLDSTAGLLDALAEAWNATTCATACFVSLFDGKQIEGLFCHDGETIRVSHGATQWTSATATDALAESLSSRTTASITVVPFELDGDTPGGVLLFGSKSLKKCRPLAEVSARLISQLSNGRSEGPGVERREPSEDSPGISDATGGLLSPTSGTHVSHCDRQLRDRKLEAMAEFSAGAGHEINNPVATIVGRTSLLLKTEVDPERRRSLETIGGQALRIRDMIGDAMTFARPPEPVCEPIVATEHVQKVVASLKEQFARREIELKLNIEDAGIHADGEQFRVVVSCLLRNSLEAIGHGGTVTASLARNNDASDFVRLTVRDTGPGLDAIEAEHLFDPFFSGRQAGRGLGFGLSRCWRILQMHGGGIDVENAEGESGFAIHTDWPVAREA